MADLYRRISKAERMLHDWEFQLRQMEPTQEDRLATKHLTDELEAFNHHLIKRLGWGDDNLPYLEALERKRAMIDQIMRIWAGRVGRRLGYF